MSDCFKLYSENLCDTATITSDTENALFPLTNLVDKRRSKVFRSTSNSSYIIFDFGETSEIDSIFIMGSKQNGLGISTATLELNGTANFTSPAYSASVSLTDQFGLGYLNFTQKDYRFARLVMTSTLGFCEVSNVFLGKVVPLSVGINFGWTTKDDDLSIKSLNRYGQKFIDVIEKQRTFNYAFKLLTKTDVELINVLIDTIGERNPFYISIGNSNMAVDYRRYSGPVMLEESLSITNASFNRFNLSMSVKEVM